MRKFSLYTSTALGILIGGLAFNAVPAFADMPTIDIAAVTQASTLR